MNIDISMLITPRRWDMRPIFGRLLYKKNWKLHTWTPHKQNMPCSSHGTLQRLSPRWEHRLPGLRTGKRLGAPRRRRGDPRKFGNPTMKKSRSQGCWKREEKILEMPRVRDIHLFSTNQARSRIRSAAVGWSFDSPKQRRRLHDHPRLNNVRISLKSWRRCDITQISMPKWWFYI